MIVLELADRARNDADAALDGIGLPKIEYAESDQHNDAGPALLDEQSANPSNAGVSPTETPRAKPTKRKRKGKRLSRQNKVQKNGKGKEREDGRHVDRPVEVVQATDLPSTASEAPGREQPLNSLDLIEPERHIDQCTAASSLASALSPLLLQPQVDGSNSPLQVCNVAVQDEEEIYEKTVEGDADCCDGASMQECTDKHKHDVQQLEEEVPSSIKECGSEYVSESQESLVLEASESHTRDRSSVCPHFGRCIERRKKACRECKHRHAAAKARRSSAIAAVTIFKSSPLSRANTVHEGRFVLKEKKVPSVSLLLQLVETASSKTGPGLYSRTKNQPRRLASGSGRTSPRQKGWGIECHGFTNRATSIPRQYAETLAVLGAKWEQAQLKSLPVRAGDLKAPADFDLFSASDFRLVAGGQEQEEEEGRADSKESIRQSLWMNRWSDEETRALQQGVLEQGRGKWKAILLSRHGAILARRTGRDLKDKIAQMVKTIEHVANNANVLAPHVQQAILRALPLPDPPERRQNEDELDEEKIGEESLTCVLFDAHVARVDWIHLQLVRHAVNEWTSMQARQKRRGAGAAPSAADEQQKRGKRVITDLESNTASSKQSNNRAASAHISEPVRKRAETDTKSKAPGTVRLKKEGERRGLAAQLAQEGLRLVEIAPDGHCLFAAISDQLRRNPSAESAKSAITQSVANASSCGQDGGEGGGGLLHEVHSVRAHSTEEVSNQEVHTYRSLRRCAASYMLKNKDHFRNFLSFERDTFEGYCSRIGRGNMWGGQHELIALSHCLKRNIHVFRHDMSSQRYCSIIIITLSLS